jgi:hypothetical protein
MTGKKREVPLTAAAREKRDRLILGLFLAGYSKHDIATHPQVSLTWQRVNDIINAELERTTKDQVLLNEQAMTIYLARLEMLVQEAFSHVQAGELKAIEPARRLLAEQAKLFGIVDDARAGATPPMSDNELIDQEEDDSMDELTRYRMDKGSKPPKAAGES